MVPAFDGAVLAGLSFLAHGFVAREAAQGLEKTGEVAGGDDVAEMLSELVVRLVMVSLTVASSIVLFIRSTWLPVHG